jgi:hypothetical protein
MTSGTAMMNIANLRTLRLASAAGAAMILLCLAAHAEDAARASAPSDLSSHKSYAEEVAAECLRNRAYGLSTNGLSLKNFCDRLGNTAALQARAKFGGAQGRPGVNGFGLQK